MKGYIHYSEHGGENKLLIFILAGRNITWSISIGSQQTLSAFDISSSKPHSVGYSGKSWSSFLSVSCRVGVGS